jgi:hypothetical protein
MPILYPRTRFEIGIHRPFHGQSYLIIKIQNKKRGVEKLIKKLPILYWGGEYYTVDSKFIK